MATRRAGDAGGARHARRRRGGVATTHGLPGGRGLCQAQTRPCVSHPRRNHNGGGGEGGRCHRLRCPPCHPLTFQPGARLRANHMNHRRGAAARARYGSVAHDGGPGDVSKLEIPYRLEGRVGREAALGPHTTTNGPGATGAVVVSSTVARLLWMVTGRVIGLAAGRRYGKQHPIPSENTKVSQPSERDGRIPAASVRLCRVGCTRCRSCLPVSLRRCFTAAARPHHSPSGL